MKYIVDSDDIKKFLNEEEQGYIIFLIKKLYDRKVSYEKKGM